MNKDVKPEATEPAVEVELSTGDQIRADLVTMEKESPDMTLTTKEDPEPKAEPKATDADPKLSANEPVPATTDDKVIAKKEEDPVVVAEVTDPELINPLLAHMTPVKPDAQPDQNTLLLQQVQQLQTQITALQAAPKPAPKAEVTAPAESTTPQFQFEVQEQLINAIQSDDPALARQGISYLAQAIAKNTYDQVMKQVETRVKSVEVGMAEMPTQLSVQAENERIQADYYGAFPSHANFREIVKEEAGKLSALYPQNNFDTNFRNALGTIVNRRLEAFGINVAPAAVVPLTPAPKHTTNTRRTADSSDSSKTITSEILNLL